MRARLLAVVLALVLLLPALAGCAARDEAECPVTEFDSEQTVEREEGLAVTLKQKTVTLENENAELIRKYRRHRQVYGRRRDPRQH